jgi:hypothetical protein
VRGSPTTTSTAACSAARRPAQRGRYGLGGA